MGQNKQSATEESAEPIKLSFSVPQIIGGALAAATAAAVGSQLGVAGTIIGASVASIIGGVAGTLYSAGLDRTHRKVAAAIRRTQPGDVELTEEQVLQLESTRLEEPAATPARQSRPRDRRRLIERMVLSAAAIFVVAVASITVVELGLGRSFSGVAGTSIGHLSPRGTAGNSTSQPTATATATTTVTASAKPSPTATESSTAPSVTPEPTAPATTATPVPGPSGS